MTEYCGLACDLAIPSSTWRKRQVPNSTVPRHRFRFCLSNRISMNVFPCKGSFFSFSHPFHFHFTRAGDAFADFARAKVNNSKPRYKALYML